MAGSPEDEISIELAPLFAMATASAISGESGMSHLWTVLPYFLFGDPAAGPEVSGIAALEGWASLVEERDADLDAIPDDELLRLLVSPSSKYGANLRAFRGLADVTAEGSETLEQHVASARLALFYVALPWILTRAAGDGGLSQGPDPSQLINYSLVNSHSPSLQSEFRQSQRALLAPVPAVQFSSRLEAEFEVLRAERLLELAKEYRRKVRHELGHQSTGRPRGHRTPSLERDARAYYLRHVHGWSDEQLLRWARATYSETGDYGSKRTLAVRLREFGKALRDEAPQRDIPGPMLRLILRRVAHSVRLELADE